MRSGNGFKCIKDRDGSYDDRVFEKLPIIPDFITKGVMNDGLYQAADYIFSGEEIFTGETFYIGQLSK
jgi:hypothetical protein